jgi:hypothetical protein
MTSRTIRLSVLLLASVSGWGCDGDGDAGAPLEPSPVGSEAASISTGPNASGAETDKDFCITRNDHTSTVTVAAGNWGSWASCPSMCPDGSFAYGASLKAEHGFEADETYLNAVSLNCNDRVTGAWTANVTSKTGPWGEWWALNMCPNADIPMVGGIVKYLSPQPALVDDSAANHMWGACANGTELPLKGTGVFGTWRSWVSCPAGTAVCGITTRVEGSQGAGDDTALNGIRFECCQFCPVGQRACGPNFQCLPTAQCPPLPVIR